MLLVCMKIYVETPVKVKKGDFLVVDDVQEKGCHCGTKQYIVHLKTEGSLAQDVNDTEVSQQTRCYL